MTRIDRHLLLAVCCALIAWALALVRFGVAIGRHEHGMDATLSAVLSVALPGIVVGAFAHALARRDRTSSRAGREKQLSSPSGNVVPLRKRDGSEPTSSSSKRYGVARSHDTMSHS